MICMKKEDLQELMKSIVLSSSYKLPQNKNNDQQIRDRTCFNCGNPGHYAKFCPQKQTHGSPKETSRWTPAQDNGYQVVNGDNARTRTANPKHFSSLN